MKQFAFCCILFITTSCLSQNNDIKLRADIYSISDSVFSNDYGSNYYNIDQDLKFGLILYSDSNCYVDSCNYILLCSETYEATIKKICNRLTGKNIANYCKNKQYPSEIRILISKQFLSKSHLHKP